MMVGEEGVRTGGLRGPAKRRGRTGERFALREHPHAAARAPIHGCSDTRMRVSGQKLRIRVTVRG